MASEFRLAFCDGPPMDTNIAYVIRDSPMPRRSCCTAVIAALLLAAPTAQASTVGFSSLWVFGDSLSDTGNFFAATGQVGEAPTVGRPYFEGRRSNGPLWSDHLAADFAAKNRPAGNFAFIGAKAVADTDGIPDLRDQVGAFRGRVPPAALGHRPVATLWFGANDVFAGVDDGNAEARGIAAANSVGAAARALAAAGIDDFVIPNLPNLGQTPFYNLYEPLGALPPGQQALATEGSTAFNNTIARQADALRRSGLNVIEVDIADLFERLIADPTEFGLIDARLPCLFLPGTGRFFGQPDDCSGDTPLERAFYDWVHPNSVVHAGIADIVRADVAPVPLPAPALLLLLGLAGLGVAARRRATA